MNYWKDKVVWITGASSGIGESLCLLLANQGARLVLSARRVDELSRVASATKLGERDLLILPFDLANTSGASGLAAQVINHFGRIDVLILNGGQSQRSTALETTPDQERYLMEVNYFSAVNLAKAVVPYMRRQRAGNLVVISSIAGKFGFYLRSSYSAAKHALHGYFESMQLEVHSENIKVLLVCPGKIRTNISVNALAKGESTHGKMDESHLNAMSPDKCARQVMKGIEKNRKEILIGGKEVTTVYLKRFFPALLYRILLKQDPY